MPNTQKSHKREKFKKAEKALRKLSQKNPESSLIKLEEQKYGLNHSYYALKTDENKYIYLKLTLRTQGCLTVKNH